MRIGILGGTFNPIHSAHLQMADLAKRTLSLDLVLLMVAANPPHKRVACAIDGAHRYRMAALAAEPHEGIEACDMELKRTGRSYTFDTLTALKARYPGAELFWIVGSDMLLDMPTWYRADELLQLASVIALPRIGEAARDAEAARLLRERHGARVYPLDRAVEPISSTEVRARAFTARPTGAFVPPPVERYFTEEGLYLPQDIDALRVRMREVLPERRYRHVCGTVRMAATLAERYGADDALYARARLAALLHDCAKQTDMATLRLLSGDDTEGAESVLHAFAGAVLAKTVYGVTDEAVLRAIRLHTTGDARMTKLDCIVYLADLTEPERDYPGVEAYRAHLGTDEWAAMRYALAGTIARLTERGMLVHPASLRARHDLDE